MRERLQQRLAELRTEFESGQQTLDQLETQAGTVRQTLLRISGAIQVLEEELGDTGQPHGNSSEQEAETVTGSATASSRS
ncbi:MAG TPA: hypothetical protein VHM16_08255, partial [Rubrobacteraceae bacterium]|nr:hypothetical protein [Rubrobacteraceae bacterium]